jgi:phage-related protein
MAVSRSDKPLAWLHGEIKTPPFSRAARLEVGFLLRQLQCGEALSMPKSRPTPVVGRRCHELRVSDSGNDWRVIYRVDEDAVVILAVFAKKTRATPDALIKVCSKRLKEYDDAAGQEESSRKERLEDRKRKGLS